MKKKIWIELSLLGQEPTFKELWLYLIWLYNDFKYIHAAYQGMLYKLLGCGKHCSNTCLSLVLAIA